MAVFQRVGMCTYDSVEVSDFLVAPFSVYHQSNLGLPKLDSVPGHRTPCLFHEPQVWNKSPFSTWHCRYICNSSRTRCSSSRLRSASISLACSSCCRPFLSEDITDITRWISKWFAVKNMYRAYCIGPIYIFSTYGFGGFRSTGEVQHHFGLRRCFRFLTWCASEIGQPSSQNMALVLVPSMIQSIYC